jgi:hypothetical protein
VGRRLGIETELVVAVDAGSFDDIRRMVDACESAGFLELR